jgi:hypothetical protein
MLVCTSWKQRPLSPEQVNRMMSSWGKLEAAQAENATIERLCWYISSDGSGGFTVNKIADSESAVAFELETSLALGEFLELESKIVLDLDTALPAILKGVERING